MDDWDRDGLWGMHGGLGWGGWLVVVILLLLLAALVIAIVISLLRPLAGHGGQGPTSAAPARSEAERLLDDRYARGEIDEIEYLHRRAVLRGG
jgi:putative membrane protein